MAFVKEKISNVKTKAKAIDDILLWGAILSGVAGVAGGIGSAITRKNDLDAQQRILGYQYNEAQKEKQAQRAVLEGNLTASTLDSNAAKRQAALESSAAEAQARAVAGTSGASGGTPFYAIDKMLFDNQRQLNELDLRVSTQQGITQKQFEAGAISMDAQLGAMGLQAAELAKDVDYAGSLLGVLLPGAAGAMQGVSTGVNFANTLVGMGFGSEKVTSGKIAGQTSASNKSVAPNTPSSSYGPVQGAPQIKTGTLANSMQPNVSPGFFTVPGLWDQPSFTGDFMNQPSSVRNWQNRPAFTQFNLLGFNHLASNPLI